MRALFLALSLAPGLVVQAQTPVPPSPFEVVSIKPLDANDKGPVIEITPGGNLNTRVSVFTLMQMAYNVKPFLIAGAPRWLDSEQYRIVAITPSGTSSKNPPTLATEMQQRI